MAAVLVQLERHDEHPAVRKGGDPLRRPAPQHHRPIRAPRYLLTLNAPRAITDITVDAEVYDGLHSVIGRRRISRFLNDLARPHVVGQALAAGYAAMATDEAREAAAEAWTEGLAGDVADEPGRHGG